MRIPSGITNIDFQQLTLPLLYLPPANLVLMPHETLSGQVGGSQGYPR